ncbi:MULTISPECIES: DUF2339 domain-containing protein [Pacificibacter]|uniref:DUF2339 domain-containing protein n=1 Tax=Pacificibacter TaxID=1042323 RepID=UPI001C08F9A0|nr:DUF2339 domain-containing protein [Pacificibacter sp. 1_MG-2023]MBU2937572.1 DUF2339 domain-containing protein [Pacificibacter marinus]MDO6616703.1 DUF2339 domain-containing protein [Pacificibacter sp. 1_MG-2023]
MEDSLIGLAIAVICIFVVLLPIGTIYLLVSNAALKTRLSQVEKQVSQLKKRTQDMSAVAAPNIVAAQALSTQAQDPKVELSLDKATEAQVVRPTSTVPKVTKPDVEPPHAEPNTEPRNMLFDRFIGWLVQNWFYVISAVSLALAGVYFVIYSMEQGLLPPTVRVMLTFGFGAALIGVGEFLRRRFGDENDKSTAYLPSTFSGAGIVTFFAGVLLARFLYGFIGPEIALIGLALIGALAMVFGWFYGPFLAAVGIIGAMAAPFVIGGSSDTPEFLFIYFAVITVTGLLIDTFRRWAWVSVLSLALGFVTGGALVAGAGASVIPAFIAFCLVLAFAAIVIPMRSLTPQHTGNCFTLVLSKGRKTWPDFPICLAAASVLVTSVLITLAALDSTQSLIFWTAIFALSVMVLSLLIWARKAEALVDLAMLPAIGLVVTVAQGAFVWRAPNEVIMGNSEAMPLQASFLVGLGLVISIAAAWRSLHGGPVKIFLAGAATLFAPIMAIVLEVFWQPALIMGSYGWALHALAIALVMVAMAERFARVDGADARARLSLAVLSALACITFALVLVFSLVALTIAIVLTIVAAIWLDRKYDLPWMAAFVLPGIMAVGFRLTIDPGIDWALDAPWWEMLISHGGAVAGFVLAWMLAKSVNRPRTEVLIETAVVSSFGIFLTLVLGRTVMALSGDIYANGRWLIGLTATIWLLLGVVQLRRLSLGGGLGLLRKVFAILFIGSALLQLLSSVTVMNPVLGWTEDIVGPILFNTLVPAYLVPAVALMFGAWWLKDQPKWLRATLAGMSLGLTGIWLVLTIRHAWLGPALMDADYVAPAELYTYTVALLLIGAGLIYQAIATSSATLRKAGLIVIAFAVVKVFAWDIQGLGGLIRVFSLLLLGLSLAGLAWFNRWAAERSKTIELK